MTAWYHAASVASCTMMSPMPRYALPMETRNATCGAIMRDPTKTAMTIAKKWRFKNADMRRIDALGIRNPSFGMAVRHATSSSFTESSCETPSAPMVTP